MFIFVLALLFMLGYNFSNIYNEYDEEDEHDIYDNNYMMNIG